MQLNREKCSITSKVYTFQGNKSYHKNETIAIFSINRE